jgi:factor associated with neutral sphingomyelinase activation
LQDLRDEKEDCMMDNSQYFWSRKSKLRNRFNLLLLEHNELFFEDLSVALYPAAIDKLSDIDTLKVPGRLKICSRSLIFEPNDARKPLKKYPFKCMRSSVAQYTIPGTSNNQLMCLAFTSSAYIEMKPNDKIAPFIMKDASGNIIDSISSNSRDSGEDSIRIIIALNHSTNLLNIIKKIEDLRMIYHKLVASPYNSTVINNELNPIINQHNILTFDRSHLIDYHETLLSQPTAVKQVKPLILYPGCLMITEMRIYFQPSQLNNVGETIQHFDIANVQGLYKRRYLLQQIGLEFILKHHESYFFIFNSSHDRDEMYALIQSHHNINNQESNSLITSTRRWQKREISNFEYLMILNNEADRSMNDLTQYPVFPHVISDYLSTSLNLENPNIFRDLSKPIGALNAVRLAQFQERYHSMPPGDPANGIPPPFLYGTHYSTPGYVLFYLVRVAPEYMLCLQNGKFDASDRMFHSVKELWTSCLSNPADVKELLPEFYHSNGDFLMNSNDLDLGFRHTGERLNDVELPPWAKSPRDYIKKHRQALECEYVSQHLHEWIDLIFGYKQQGPAAEEANNIYYYLTYEGSVDLEKVTNPRERSAFESQIQEFGQTPKQLFSGPHPRRDDRDAEISLCSASKKPVLDASATTDSSGDSSIQSLYVSKATSVKAGLNNDNKVVAKSRYASANEGDINVVHLGDDFRNEVARELAQGGGAASSGSSNSSSSRVSNNTSNGEKSTPGVQSIIDKIKDKTVSFWDMAFGSNTSGKSAIEADRSSSQVERRQSTGTVSSVAKAPIVSASTTPTKSIADHQKQSPIATPKRTVSTDKAALANMQLLDSAADMSSVLENLSVTYEKEKSRSESTDSAKHRVSPATLLDSTLIQTLSPSLKGEINRMVLMPSDLFDCHKSSVTSVAIMKESSGNTGLAMNNTVNCYVCTSSKDASVKLLQVNMTHSTNYVNISTNSRFTVKRTFTGSDTAVSACILTKDCKEIICSSWDNYVYSFSVTNACLIGKRLCHEDSVSSLSYVTNRTSNSNYLLSGACDATMKIWEIKNGNIGSKPLIEFYDIEGSVQCVHMDETMEFAACGVDEGLIYVWNISLKPPASESITFTYQISAGESITCIKWLPYESGKIFYSQGTFSDHKLVCASTDGTLLCVDSEGRLFAGTKVVDAKVLALECDGRTVFGGLSDSSLRGWIMANGKFSEIYHFPRAHETSPVTSLAMDQDIIITGADNGSIRVWTVTFAN